MTARPLVLFPDPRLRHRAEPVETFGPDLASLAADLTDTLGAVSAVGLTGPHIGVPQRVIVIRILPDQEPRIYVNPSVLWSSPERATHEEGSVSMPGARERIERSERVRVAFQTLAGEARDEEASGFEAAVLQHEIDQLDGVFWVDRLSRLRRERLIKRYGKVTKR